LARPECGVEHAPLHAVLRALGDKDACAEDARQLALRLHGLLEDVGPREERIQRLQVGRDQTWPLCATQSTPHYASVERGKDAR
jgi:hypothetical protein